MTENSTESMVNIDQTTENNNHRKNYILIITISVVVLACVVSLMLWMMHQNNIKQEQIRATERIDSICDELYEIESFSGDSEYAKANDKVKEIESLIEKNNLQTEMEEKCADVKSYVADLNTYRFISENYYTLDESKMRQVHTKIETLTNDKIISKLTDNNIPNTLAENVLTVIQNKVIEEYQKYLKSERNATSFDYTVVYDENKGAYTEDYIFIGSYPLYGYGLEGTVNTSNGYNYLVWINGEMPPESRNNINENGKKAFFVKYNIGEDSWFSYLYVGYDVSVKYVNGLIRYDVTEYSSGLPNTEYGLTINDILSRDWINIG